MSFPKNSPLKSMMRLFLPFFCTVFFLYSNLQAQNDYDNVWVLGYTPSDSVNYFGGTLLRFDDGVMTKQYFDITLDMYECPTNISNTQGQLQFYSNGCRIIDQQNGEMQNGDDLNPGEPREAWCKPDYGAYRLHQGILTLPEPGNDQRYVLFHLAWEAAPVFPYTQTLNTLYYTRVDMSLNSGLGAVTDKNHVLLQDTSLMDNLTAVRHGNGRDWWIVQPKGLSDTLYLFLLSPYGISGPFIRTTGLKSNMYDFTTGQASFSPDGQVYVRSNKLDGILIMDFDRCSGEFWPRQTLPYPGLDMDPVCGSAISPSSRYLYVSATRSLFQYDLWAPDIEGGKILLDTFDFFTDIYGSSPAFYQLMLAPDGKIYMSCPNTTRFLHVIAQPDSAGTACLFRQRGLQLFTHHGFCLPNFPHFRLYDVQGSPCDTLGIDAPIDKRTLYAPEGRVRFVPNPASAQVLCSLPPNAGGRLRVHNLAGQLLLEQMVGYQPEFTLDVSEWPAGMYLVSVTPADGRKPVAGKLVVSRAGF